MSARFLVKALYFLLIIQSPISAQVIVTGTVKDVGGKPLTRALVRVFDGPHPIGLAPEPADLQGQFRIRVEVQTVDRLRCEVSATGYVTERRNLVVSKGIANTGEIRLSHVKGLRLGALSAIESGDGRFTYIDVLVQNEGESTVEVASQSLRGTARAETECSSPAPTIMFSVSDTVEQDRVRVTVGEQDSAKKDQIKATGKLEMLPCRQMRLELVIPTTYLISPGEKLKLRFAVPTVMHDPEKQRTSVSLNAWDSLQLSLSLGDGSTVSAGLREEP